MYVFFIAFLLCPASVPHSSTSCPGTASWWTSCTSILVLESAFRGIKANQWFSSQGKAESSAKAGMYVDLMKAEQMNEWNYEWLITLSPFFFFKLNPNKSLNNSILEEKITIYLESTCQVVWPPGNRRPQGWSWRERWGWINGLPFLFLHLDIVSCVS